MTKTLAIIFLAVVLIALVLFATQRTSNTLPSRAEDILSPVANTPRVPPPNAAPPVTTGEQKQLQKYFQDYITSRGLNTSVGLYYKNLAKGYEIKINADQVWNPASTVKAYLVVEAYRQKQLGLINFDQRVVIKDANVVPTELESDDYQPLRAGVRATIRELISAMVTQSDNTAFNTLLGVLDRRNVSATLKKYGLLNTTVGEKLNLNDAQLALDLQVPGRQPNTTTASDFGLLFDLLYNHKIYGSEEIITIFKEQKISNMLPSLLPPDTIIAHKTGDFDVYHHDGGIIYKPDEPYILTVFTSTGNPQAVAQLSKIAYYKNSSVLGISAERSPNFLEQISSFLNLFPSPIIQ